METIDSRGFLELMTELIAMVDEVVSLAKDPDTEREVFTEFALLVKRFSPILNELRDNEKSMDMPTIQEALESLEKQLKRSKVLIKSPNSNTFVKHVDEMTHDLGRSLGLLLFATLEVSTDFKEKIGDLYKELMNARFCLNSSSPSSSRVSEFVSELKVVEEIEEEEISLEPLDIGDVVMQIKYGNDEEFKYALLGLNEFTGSEKVSNEWIDDEGIIPILFNRFSSSKPENRLIIIQILRRLALENADNKVYDMYIY